MPEDGGSGNDQGIDGTVPELKALVDLIQALIKTNKRVMTLSTILGMQKLLMRQYPCMILKFKVDRNFNVACKMPGGPKDLEALGKFLELYVKNMMEVLPPSNLYDRICSTVKDLGQDAALELLASGATDLLPVELVDQIRIAADFGDRLNSLRSSDPKTQAVSIYEALYSRFLQNTMESLDPPEANLLAFCRQLEGMVRSHYLFMTRFTISDELRIDIEVGDTDLDLLLGALAHIYDSFIYGVSTIWDQDVAKNLGRRTALTVLGDFDEIPDTSGVTSSLLRGVLSSKMRTGVLGMDHILEGGLERNSNTLLISSNIIERDFLLANFIKKGFFSGEEIFVIVSSMDTDRILEILPDGRAGVGTIGRLKLHVFTPKKKEDQKEGADDEEEKEGTGSPTNLIDLNKFLIKEVREFGPGPKRALLEVLDEARTTFGEDRLYWYLTRYLSILKENGFSTIFLGSMKVLGKKLITNIMDLFENTVEIRKRTGSFSYEIGRVAAKKPVLDPKFKLITFGDRGLTITDD